MKNAYGPLVVAAAFAAVVASPAASAAQSPDPPKLTVGVGGGYGSSALHDDASGPTWEGTVRLRKNSWFGFEVVAGGLRTNVTRASTNLTSPLPDGSTGTIERIESTTTSRTDAFGFNVLVMPSFGRVTVSGGGGLGLAVYHRVYTQEAFGCSTNLANSCRRFTNDHASGGIRVQGLAGVDVALTSRWAVYGVARFGILDGYVETSAAAGVRFAIKGSDLP